MRKLVERICREIAWLLPREIVTWAFVRVVSYATSGKYGDTVVPGILAMDALKRWQLGDRH